MEERQSEPADEFSQRPAPGVEIGEITRFLREWTAGNKGALNQMMPIVVGELRRTARRQYAHMKGRGSDRPTELVSYVWERLSNLDAAPSLENSKKFYAYCARIIRHLLLDRIRSESSLRKAADLVSLDDIVELSFLKDNRNLSPEEQAAALELLSRLEQERGEAYEVFLYKGILGFKDRETAEVLDIGVSTVQTRFTLAKSWLYREMNIPAPREKR